MSSYLSPSTEIPADIFPPEMWPEYDRRADPPRICAVETVGTAAPGLRWSFWPFTFEDYVGDAEPDIASGATQGRLARCRQVSWRRVHRTDVPPGWKVSARPWRVDGYFRLTADLNYKKLWSHGAQHDLRVWDRYKAKGYSITVVSKEMFVRAYKKSTVSKKFGNDLLSVFQRKMESPAYSSNTLLWGITNPQGAIVAGTAAVYSMGTSASVRECPFVLPEGKRIRGATALMDHWFMTSIERNIRLLHSTHFWQHGDPKDWKNFSSFKSHFAFKYVAYPPALYRFVMGRFF